MKKKISVNDCKSMFNDKFNTLTMKELGIELKHFSMGTAPENPSFLVNQDELKKKIVEAIEELTEKEKSVITLYYYEEMTLKEISNVMEVSESRVSQLHTKALVKLKKSLGNYMNIFDEM